MRQAGYAWRRTRARSGLVALLTAMTMLIVLALAGTLAYLQVASATGVRDAVGAAPPAAQVIQVQTRVATDAAAEQRVGAAAVLDRLLPTDRSTWTVVRTPPIALTGAADSVQLLVDPDLASDATLLDGVWPSGPGEATLHAGAAASLEVAVGDTLELVNDGEPTPVQLVGLWQPVDPDDTRWGGDTTVATGMNPLEADTYGPLVVTEETLGTLSVVPFVQWTLTPGPQLQPADLDRWIAGAGRLVDALDSDGLTVRGVTVAGTLTTTLADIRENLASVRASSSIPLAIVALVSLVALWQIARLLSSTRDRETHVLLSRGASPRQIVAYGAAEAALVATGALLGGAVVAAVFLARPGVSVATLAAVTGAVAVAAAAVMLVVLGRSTASGLRTSDHSGRGRTALASTALVLLVALAAFSLWRLIRNGSPLLPGSRDVDAVAVLAPALTLVAAALATVALAAPVSRGLARLAARRAPIAPALELRQASRRIAVNAVPVVLVVLATAVAAIASAHAGTWAASRTLVAQLAIGADVRVTTEGGISGPRPSDIATLSGLTGVAGAAGVLEAAMRTEDAVGELTAVPMSDVGASSAPTSLLAPAEDALAPSTDPLPGLDLPTDSGALTVRVTASATGAPSDGPNRSVELVAWLSDGTDLLKVGLGGLTVPAADLADYVVDPEDLSVTEVLTPNPDAGRSVTGELDAAVPPGDWRVVALDTVFRSTVYPTSWSVAVDAVAADGTDLMASSDLEWDPAVLPGPGTGEVTPVGRLAYRSEFTGVPSGPRGGMLPTALQRFMPATDEVPVVPVVTTPGWGDEISTGGTDVTVSATTVRLQRVGTIPAVPGNDDGRAALADLPSLQNAVLRASEDVPGITTVWLDAGSSDPAALARLVQDQLGPRTEVVAAGAGVAAAVAEPARVVYWIAAVAALLLALPAIAAVALTQATARRGEVVVLRAMGMSTRQQARSRSRELLGLEIGAVAAGLLSGWGLASLVVVALVRSTTPRATRSLPIELTFAWLPGLALVLLIATTVTAVALWYGARVRAQARDTTWREETR